MGGLLLATWIAAAQAGDPSTPREIGLEEEIALSGRVIVSAPADAAAATVRTVTGDDLRSAGARSLPEALARDAGFESADQVGNGRQLSLQLRGFAPESGATALFVDGIRLNEPDTNQAPWHVLRLEDVDAVVVAPGARGAFLGQGSMAGGVSVTLRRPDDEASVDAVARAGTHGHAEIGVTADAPLRTWRFLASGGHLEQDGFRDGASVRESTGRIAVERPLRHGTFGLSVQRLDGRWRHPGALTAGELKDDPAQCPWNLLDRQELVQDLLLAHYERAEVGGRTAWKVVSGLRERREEILTTGRSGFGFHTNDSQQSLSGALEATTRLRREEAPRQAWLRWGTELAEDRLHPQGSATDDVTDGEISALVPWSVADLDWGRTAAFAHVAVELPHRFELEGGARHDRSRVTRRGRELDFSTGLMQPVSGERSFDDTTFRAGLARDVDAGPFLLRVHAARDESFLSPSAIQLFAYPGFGSNPDLDAQRATSWSAGLRASSAAVDWEVEVVATRVDDEIVFDESGAGGPRNVNAGTSRRRGVEARLAWRARPDVVLRAAHSLMDARFVGGFPPGTRVAKDASIPLVPRWRASVRLDLGPWHGVSALLDVAAHGPSPLSADLDNSAEELGGRVLVAAGARWSLPGRHGLELALHADNLLDERTPGRGVEHFDQPYFTPTTPRTVTLTLTRRSR